MQAFTLSFTVQLANGQVTLTEGPPAMPARSLSIHHDSHGPAIIPFPRRETSPEVEELRESLIETYHRLCLPRDREELSPSSIESTLSGLKAFEGWYVSRPCSESESAEPPDLNPRTTRPGVRTVSDNPSLLWEFAGHQRRNGNDGRGWSVDTVRRQLIAVTKVIRAGFQAGICGSVPDRPATQAIEKMGSAMLAATPFNSVDVPETVTLDEFRKLRAACHVAEWPNLPGVSAQEFWEAVCDCHWTYGFRSQDWFGVKTAAEKGLLWSQLSLEPICPIRELKGLESPAGWVSFWMRKGKRHIFLPLSVRIRQHIDRFKEIDSERVFPNPRNKRAYYDNFNAIKAAAGIDSRITLSGRTTPSLRKGCTLFWDGVESGNLTSTVLGHSLGNRNGSQRSTITDKHYAQLVRKVCNHIEAVPF